MTICAEPTIAALLEERFELEPLGSQELGGGAAVETFRLTEAAGRRAGHA
jgi:hypothetical protein